MQNLPLHIYGAFKTAEQPDVLLQGFQKYLKSDLINDHVQYQVVSGYHGVKLRRYASSVEAAQSLFIIPSLINDCEIFDLTRETSFIRFVLSQGLDVYLIDWGDLTKSFSGSLNNLFEHILHPLWDNVCKDAHMPPHVLGYCLGGTLAATFFSQPKQTLPASLTFLATPFDFSVDHASWSYVIDHPHHIKSQIRIQNCLSQRMLQSHFINVQPTFIINKFKAFLNMTQGSFEEQRFIAVERWLNEGPDVPMELSLDLIEHYFVQNKALEDLQRLPDISHTIIYSENDQIVPYASAIKIKYFHKNVGVIQTDCGHVGMMVGRGAKETVWHPFTERLKAFAAQQI